MGSRETRRCASGIYSQYRTDRNPVTTQTYAYTSNKQLLGREATFFFFFNTSEKKRSDGLFQLHKYKNKLPLDDPSCSQKNNWSRVPQVIKYLGSKLQYPRETTYRRSYALSSFKTPLLVALQRSWTVFLDPSLQN